MNPYGSATNKPRKAVTLILRTAYYFFVMSGILGLVYAAYALADAHAYQALETSRFENESVIRSDEPHHVVQGDAIGEMEVPRLGLKAIVRPRRFS